MKITLRFLLPLASAISIVGCARMSLTELRSEPPARQNQYVVPYGNLGTCIVSDLQSGPRGRFGVDVGDFSYELINHATEQRMTITAKDQDFIRFDLTVRASAGGGSTVETRWGTPWSGGAQASRPQGIAFGPQVQATIDQCAVKLQKSPAGK